MTILLGLLVANAVLLQHETTIEKLIFVVGAAILVSAAVQQFGR